MLFEKQALELSITHEIPKGHAECYLINFKNNSICCSYNNGCKNFDKCKEIYRKENIE